MELSLNQARLYFTFLAVGISFLLGTAPDVHGAKHQIRPRAGFPSLNFGSAGSQVSVQGRVRIALPVRFRKASRQAKRAMNRNWRIYLQEWYGGRWLTLASKRLRIKGKGTIRKRSRFTLFWKAPTDRTGAIVRVKLRHRKRVLRKSARRYLKLDPQAEFPPTVTVESEEVLQMPSGQSNDLVVPDRPGVQPAKPGSVLRSAPEMSDPQKVFLLKVVKVTRKNGTVIYGTKPGSIFSAVPSGSFTYQANGIDDVRANLRRLSGPIARAASSGDYKLMCRIGAGGAYKVGFEPSVDIVGEMKWHTEFGLPPRIVIDDLSLKGLAELRGEASAALESSAGCGFEATVASLEFRRPILVGGFPIVLTLTIPITTKASASASGRVEVKASASIAGEIGFRYSSSSGLQPISSVIPQASFGTPHSLSMALSAEIAAEVRASLGYPLPALGDLALESGFRVSLGLDAHWAPALSPKWGACVPYSGSISGKIYLPLVDDIDLGSTQIFGGDIRCWGSGGKTGWITDPLPEPSSIFKRVKSGWTFSCGLKLDDKAYCWGSSDYKQLEAPSVRLRSMDVGAHHACGVEVSGKLVCWGDSDNGQTSPPAGSFKIVSVGGQHACAIATDDTLSCWGDDGYGRTEPPLGAFRSVSVGVEGACAVQTNSYVKCWGEDTYYETQPPQVKFKSVSLGGYHACGITTDDKVRCWGAGKERTTPPSGSFLSLSAGPDHTCGVRSSGLVACWGIEAYQRTVPPGGIFEQVDSGAWHTCGLHPNGTIECWGSNSSGQLYKP